MVIRPRKGMKNIPTKCKSMCSSMSWISKCLKLKALNLQHTKKDAVGGGGGLNPENDKPEKKIFWE